MECHLLLEKPFIDKGGSFDQPLLKKENTLKILNKQAIKYLLMLLECLQGFQIPKEHEIAQGQLTYLVIISYF